MFTEKIQLLRKIPLFTGLSYDNLSQIAIVSKYKKFLKEQIIFSENTFGKTLFITISGRVKIFTELRKRRKILTYLEKRDFFGELCLLGQSIRSATAQADTDCELLLIYRDDFLKILKKYPNISLNLLKTLAKRLREADKEIESLSFLSVLARIAKVLVVLSKKYGKPDSKGILIDFNTSHEIIAEMAGTVREMVTRCLKKLIKIDCVEILGKKIIVKNMEKLSNFVC